MKQLKIRDLLIAAAAFLAPLMLTTAAYAHVVVKPAEVGVAAFQTFTTGVPNEKDQPIIALRLVTPEGLQSVSPNVKPGWTIDVKKSGEGDSATVTEINWTGGSIPAGQRDDFLFSAQVPAKETTLTWKAYQTYADGTLVSWDQTPVQNVTDAEREEMEKTGKGPYSQTKVINDLATPAAATTAAKASSLDKVALTISIVALALAAVAVGLKSKR